MPVSGPFDPAQTGGMEAGWQARLSHVREPPVRRRPGEIALDRVELEVWWTRGGKRRTFTLERYRPRV